MGNSYIDSATVDSLTEVSRKYFSTICTAKFRGLSRLHNVYCTSCKCNSDDYDDIEIRLHSRCIA